MFVSIKKSTQCTFPTFSFYHLNHIYQMDSNNNSPSETHKRYNLDRSDKPQKAIHAFSSNIYRLHNGEEIRQYSQSTN